MASARARNVLAFLRYNIENEIETMQEARQFIRRLDGLTETEILFLECALQDQSSVEIFHAAAAAPRF